MLLFFRFNFPFYLVIMFWLKISVLSPQTWLEIAAKVSLKIFSGFPYSVVWVNIKFTKDSWTVNLGHLFMCAINPKMLIISLPYSTIPPAGSASAVKLLSFTTVRLYSLSILLQVKLWVHAERCRSTSAAAADSSWHSGRGPVHPGPVTNSFQDKHIQTDHHLGRCMSASILGQDAWPQIASDGSIGVCGCVCEGLSI